MNEKLGTILKEARANVNLSQRELADKVGVSKSYINKMENGLVKKPNSLILNKISYILGINSFDLIEVANYEYEDILFIQQLKDYRDFCKFRDSELKKYIITYENGEKKIDINRVLKDYKKLKLDEINTIVLFLEWMNL